MAEEFYNTFHNAFTSETSETTNVTSKSISKTITDNINHDNVYGNHQRPPKLMNIEDYRWWSSRFENWVKGYAYESWVSMIYDYEKPVNEQNVLLSVPQYSKTQKEKHSEELRMVTLLQAIREDIFTLLQHGETSKSIWEALKLKAEGGKDIKKNKITLLKKEFDLFNCMKGESVRQMIERFCHLKIELESLGIYKEREEMVDKLVEALPHEEAWKTYVIVLKNDAKFDEMTLESLIEKLEGHDLLLQKQNKMSSSSYQQNVDLYYRRGMPQSNESPKIKTAFSVDKTGDSSNNKSSSYDPGYHSSSASSESSPNQDWKNSPHLNNEFTQQHMSFLASIPVSCSELYND